MQKINLIFQKTMFKSQLRFNGPSKNEGYEGNEANNGRNFHSKWGRRLRRALTIIDYVIEQVASANRKILKISADSCESQRVDTADCISPLNLPGL